MIDFLYTNEYRAPMLPAFSSDPSASLGSGASVGIGQPATQYAPTIPSPESSTVSGESAHSGAALDLSIDCNIIMHAKMYAIGTKYDIASLKAAAREKFSTAIEHAWDRPVFARVIRLVFSTTADEDEGLRNQLVEIIQRNESALACNPDVEAAILSIDKLSYRLWKANATRDNTSKGPKCLVCGNAYTQRCQDRPCKRYFVSCDCGLFMFCESHREY